MDVLIFHGYLLRGTGSNIYNASLAQALARLGHDVHLLCQDRDAASLGWVDAVGTWNGGKLVVDRTTSTDGQSASGAITVYTPDIGGLLPVYVHDRYAGFEVKTFGELSDGELDRYISANVAAVRDVAAATEGGVDVALANHMVMGPVILARAGLGEQGTGPASYAVKIHGSAMEFTVKREPERFVPYAREGLAGASGILVGSKDIARRVVETLGDEALRDRIRLGPPGVDLDLFAPRERDEAETGIRALAARFSVGVREEAAVYGTKLQGPPLEAGFGRDPRAASASLGAFAAATGPRVIFVGKLIRTKGADLLLAAWPLVVERHPGARLLIVGFGEAREALERLWGALERGELTEARAIAQSPGDQGDLKMLTAFLSSVQSEYGALAQSAAGSVSFAGRLEHEEVAAVLPAADSMVVPSTFPEAFGMVAAEAAACGVLPICAGHSGLREVADALAADQPAAVAELVSFELGDGAVRAIGERLLTWLAMPEPAREPSRQALASTVKRLWSWEGVARGVIAAAGDE